jgi:hypothetical protein
MTDGGGFNGKTVTGLGYAKVADLFYEVQTNLLTSAADYADLYDALLQACTNLGYSAGDCQEVKDTVDATEMNLQPTSCQAPEAPICTIGQSPSNLFFDDIESGAGNWTIGSNQGTAYWFVPQTTSTIGLNQPYATSGDGNIWGFDQGLNFGGTSDTFLGMNSDITLPANAYLHFNHAFGFESDSAGSPYYDGGVLEYSTDSGGSWSDAGSLFTQNGYNNTIDAVYDNPLGGRSAFTADSRGYISSRLDLSSLAGEDVRFRFRIGTDAIVYDYGWFIDDVRIYTCSGVDNPPYTPNSPSPADGATDQGVNANLSWVGDDPDGDSVTYDVYFEAGDPTPDILLCDDTSSLSCDPGSLSHSTQYHWQVIAKDQHGETTPGPIWDFTTGTQPEYKIFLPLVLKNVAGSLLNGDFESGPINWTEYSLNGWELILQESAMPNPVYAHSGIWAAWLGGDDDEISYIEQTVYVPAASPHFTYWHWIDSEEVDCGSDLGGVLVNGSTVVDIYDLCSAENTSGWVLHSLDLSAYAGQTIPVQIRVETDVALVSNLYVDDVSFEASPAPPSFIASPGSKIFTGPKSNYLLKRSGEDSFEIPRVFRP